MLMAYNERIYSRNFGQFHTVAQRPSAYIKNLVVEKSFCFEKSITYGVSLNHPIHDLLCPPHIRVLPDM